MSGYVSGGGNLLAISEGIDSDHNLTASTYADIAYEFRMNSEVGLPRDQATGYVGFALTQVDMNPTLSAKIKTWAPSSTTGEVEEITFTDGTKIGGTTGSSPDLLGINYGATHTDAAINKRPVVTAVVKLQLDAGSRTETNGQMGKPAFTFVGQKLKQGISVPAALYCTAFVNHSDPVVVAAGDNYTETWMTPAS